MISFLQPIWLLAAAGILVPLIIHLWNTRQTKILKIGSTMLLGEASRKQSTNTRISQWLLLLLRSLLVLLIACWLAMPVFSSSKDSKTKGWLLVDRSQIGGAAQMNIIDSFKRQGYETRELKEGFPVVSTGQAAIADSTTSQVNTWHLLKSADHLLPAGFPVKVLGDPGKISSLVSMTGKSGYTRPLVSIDVKWINNKIVTDQQNPPYRKTIASRIDEKGRDNINTAVLSDEWSTWFQETISNSSEGLTPDTSTKRFTIFHEGFRDDAEYLAAALRAIISFTKIKAELAVTNDLKEVNKNQDWLFWLSEREPISGELQIQRRIFAYAGSHKSAGRQLTAGSFLSTDNGPFTGTPVRLSRSAITPDSITDFVDWQDAGGLPVLSHNTANTGEPTLYKFFNRFDPAWSGLCWSPEFPAMLTALVLPDTVSQHASAYDLRKIPAEQLLPAFAKSTVKKAGEASITTGDTTDKIFWILIAITFLLERWLAMHQQKTKES